MKQELESIIEEIQGKNILVIGDMVADIYLDGRISRISREARFDVKLSQTDNLSYYERKRKPTDGLLGFGHSLGNDPCRLPGM